MFDEIRIKNCIETKKAVDRRIRSTTLNDISQSKSYECLEFSRDKAHAKGRPSST